MNTVRGLAKSMGERLPQCDADQMGVARAVSLPAQLRQVLEPLLKEVESLTEKIKNSDREIEQIARKDYPEAALLQQVGGVGPLIALTFILTIEDKNRFQKSRDVGCYVGLRPRRSDSGQTQPQLRITKEGTRTTSRDLRAASLVSQGHHGVNARGPPRRYVAGEQGHDHQWRSASATACDVALVYWSLVALVRLVSRS